jgi:hypothetical protein
MSVQFYLREKEINKWKSVVSAVCLIRKMALYVGLQQCPHRPAVVAAVGSDDNKKNDVSVLN